MNYGMKHLQMLLRAITISFGLFMWNFVLGGTVAQASESITFPEPSISGAKPLEQLLEQRRSIREFRDESLSQQALGQLLWAAQGITHRKGLRTAPSAGALYPLELYVVVGRLDGLAPGVFHYYPKKHKLENVISGDQRIPLSKAALGQAWVKEAAVVIVFAAVYERTTRKYGKRGIRYVHIEVGHAAENLFLQAEALNLGSVVVGAFDDAEVAKILRLPTDVKPLLLMPVGKK